MTSAALTQIKSDFGALPDMHGVSKYQRVANTFINAIKLGVLSPGDRLPTEGSLASELQVSLGTVQKALGLLAEQGLVDRAPRRGTFVTSRFEYEPPIYRFKDPDTGEIVNPAMRAISVTEVLNDDRCQAKLQVDRCVRIERLMWTPGDKPSYSEFFVPFDLGTDLLALPIEKLNETSIHRIIGKQFGLPTLKASHQLSCRTLTTAACRHLLLPDESIGSVWDVVGYSLERATTYQSIQLPAGHQPIEWDSAVETEKMKSNVPKKH